MSANHKIVLDYMFSFPEAKNIPFRTMEFDLSDRIEKQTLREILSEERVVGHVVVGPGGYRLSGSYRRDNGVHIATRPSHNVYGPVLAAKNIPTSYGLREGSNDHKAWPSKHV